MRILSKLFFCIFAVTFFYSCEPEEMPVEPIGQDQEIPTTEIFGDTGGNEEDVIDDKKD